MHRVCQYVPNKKVAEVLARKDKAGGPVGSDLPCTTTSDRMRNQENHRSLTTCHRTTLLQFESFAPCAPTVRGAKDLFFCRAVDVERGALV